MDLVSLASGDGRDNCWHFYIYEQERKEKFHAQLS